MHTQIHDVADASISLGDKRGSDTPIIPADTIEIAPPSRFHYPNGSAANAKETNHIRQGGLVWSNIDVMSQELLEIVDFDFDILGEVLSNNDTIIVTYSGGKDSTVVTHLVLAALLTLESPPTTHVVTVDTLVEIPVLRNHSMKFLNEIQVWADAKDLPVQTHLLHPDPEKTYWACLIGKGYMPPSFRFRWCVRRLKIRPVRDMIRALGENVVVLMGTRKDESKERERTINRRSTEERWMDFEGADNARVYMPIVEWKTGHVWEYLLRTNPPWDSKNSELYFLYFNSFDGCTWNADGGFSCGGNRFGCWTCTVVRKDKAMERLSELDPDTQTLLQFKRWLREMKQRDDKRCAYNRRGGEGKGPFTLSARREIYSNLKKLEKKLEMELITDEEEEVIRRYWQEDEARGFFDISFSQSNGE